MDAPAGTRGSATTLVARYGDGPARLVGLVALETWVASAFGIAQPLLSLLGANQTFFVAHETRGSAVVAYTAVLLFVVPLVIIAAELVTGSLLGGVATAMTRTRAGSRSGTDSPSSTDDGRSADQRPVVDDGSSTDDGTTSPEGGSPTLLRRGIVWVHVVVVGVLVSAGLAPAVLRSLEERTLLWSVAAVLVTVVAVVAIARLRVLTTFLRFLAFAPVLFAVHFLFMSPVSSVVTGGSAGPGSALGTADTPPLVWVVLDEGTLPVIVDADGNIDARRFPNFARLADVSTWYPNATAGTIRTDLAVPAALSGMWPRWNQTPIDSEYPRNLFTILASDDYPVSANELITYLCPEKICGEREGDQTLWPDTRAVYFRYLLPDTIADRFVPRVDRGWNDFGAQIGADGTADEKVFLADVRSLAGARVFVEQGEANKDVFAQLVDDVAGPDLAGLHYTHLLLPHEPMRYLPDGREMTLTHDIAPDSKGRWPDDEPTMRTRLQRVISQTMLADRMIGQLLDALEDSGNLERTALVVMGDHGGITRPGSVNRPMWDQDSLVDVTSNIVMIKAPGQTVGRVDPHRIQQVDILPTVLETMGFDQDVIEGKDGPAMDGLAVSDTHRDQWQQRRPTWLTPDGPVEMTDPTDYRDSPVTPWIEQVFGDSSDPFRMLPDGDLVDTEVDLDSYGPTDLSARLDAPDLFSDVDLGLRRIPAYVSGVFDEPPGGSSLTADGARLQVAVVVGGRIGGVGESFQSGAHRFAMLIDPSLLRSGHNTIDILVRPVADGGTGSSPTPWVHPALTNRK